jgi:hypothetical protein
MLAWKFISLSFEKEYKRRKFHRYGQLDGGFLTDGADLGAGCWVLNAGYWVLGTGYWVLGVGNLT